MSEHLRENASMSSDLRVLLLGNIGCGKTSSADTILGRVSHANADSRSCRLRQGLSEGRSVSLVEAPRWYWNGCKMEDGVRKETQRAMTLLAPGPHAVLLLVPVSQFTEVHHRHNSNTLSILCYQIGINIIHEVCSSWCLFPRWRVGFLQSWESCLGRRSWITRWCCSPVETT